MKKQLTSTAVVTVTVEVPTGTYGVGCLVGDIVEQAAREGVAMVRNLLGGKGRVVGEPSVRTVTVMEETP